MTGNSEVDGFPAKDSAGKNILYVIRQAKPTVEIWQMQSAQPVTILAQTLSSRKQTTGRSTSIRDGTSR
ncbi:MAG: hypothetical protein ACRD8O_16380 [Bryobacteraceae bacterium]